MVWALTVILGYEVTPTWSFNLDMKASYVMWEPASRSQNRHSYFGYSIALYASRGTAWALVGAPRANNTQWSFSASEIPEPGALYACSLSDSEALKCNQILVDPTGNDNSNVPLSYKDLKNYGWLGGSLDLLQQDVTEPIVVTCSPRWKNQIFSGDYYINGACYWASVTQLLDSSFSSDSWNKVIPLVDINLQLLYDPATGYSVYYYELGQAGISAHVMKDNQGIVLGAPGVKTWAGTVATVQKFADWNIVDSRFRRLKRSNTFQTKTNVFTPYTQLQEYDYFGYSLTSGRFWGESYLIVAGAPRADTHGKVYIFRTTEDLQLVIEWVGMGSQLGCGYGHAVAADDVTGDGWSELFVGAPMYSSSVADTGSSAEVWDAGAVEVYKSGSASKSGLSMVARLQGSLATPGARFGSAISVIGDLDRDGFNDVAVGAPYEDDGRGVVYIFRGSANGLMTKYAQRILARDLHQDLRSFGISISRGVDVDTNGYVDVGVGAYGSEGEEYLDGVGAAAVLRTRSVATLSSRVTSKVAVITDPTAEVEVDLCLAYNGDGVQWRVDMEVEGSVDEETKVTPKAIFVISGTSQLTSSLTLQKDVETCTTFKLRLKDNLDDLEQPLYVTFTSHSQDFDPGRPWCAECSVLSPESTTMVKISLPLALGCGTDGRCTPTLSLQADWTSGLSSGRYIVSSMELLILRIQVKVTGEPAYQGLLQVTLPPGMSLRTLPFACFISTSTTVACELQNPLYETEETLEVMLQEEEEQEYTGLREIMGKNVESVDVEIELNANGAASQMLNVPLHLTYDVQLKLEGYGDVDYVYYDSNLTSPTATPEVIFKVENTGVTRVSDTTLQLLVPLAYSPPSGEENVTFGIVTKALVSPEGGINLCRAGVPGTITGGVGEAVVGETSIPPEDIDLKVACGMAGVVCQQIVCTVGGLHLAPRVHLTLLYNLTMLIARYGPNTTVAINTWATLRNSFNSDLSTTLSTDTWVSLVPRGWVAPSLPPKEAPFWVYIVGVVVGVAVMVIIILVLIKIGFFRRKKLMKETTSNLANEDLEAIDSGDLPLADDVLEEEQHPLTNVSESFINLTTFSDTDGSNGLSDGHVTNQDNAQ